MYIYVFFNLYSKRLPGVGGVSPLQVTASVGSASHWSTPFNRVMSLARRPDSVYKIVWLRIQSLKKIRIPDLDP